MSGKLYTSATLPRGERACGTQSRDGHVMKVNNFLSLKAREFSLLQAPLFDGYRNYFPRLKRSERVVDYSPPCRASTPLIYLHGMEGAPLPLLFMITFIQGSKKGCFPCINNCNMGFNVTF